MSRPINHTGYRELLEAELADNASLFSGKQLQSIYIGGGTPSLWNTQEISTLLGKIRATFATEQDIEVTIECNPGDCTEANLSQWQKAGINRLSIGAQSIHARDLAVLGRDHSMGDGLAAISRAKAAGFTNFSADVILGIPRSNSRETLAALAALDVPHISAYELTIEPQTPLASQVRKGQFVPVSDDAMTDMLMAAAADLRGRGYDHYEISSFAKPGHRSIHNSLYWSGACYLGLGVGACSYRPSHDNSARRWQNGKTLARYRAGARVQDETLPPRDNQTDAAWLGLRTIDGIALEAVSPAASTKLRQDGLATIENGRLVPTERGFLFHDRIIRLILEYS